MLKIKDLGIQAFPQSRHRMAAGNDRSDDCGNECTATDEQCKGETLIQHVRYSSAFTADAVAQLRQQLDQHLGY